MKTSEVRDWLSKIDDLGKKDTPYLLTDLDIIEQKVRDFKALIPRVEVYYAVKSNNDPSIIKRLKNVVEGYDIASLGEFRLLNSLGVSSDKIVYSNPVKVPNHIDVTYERGVRFFALDSAIEIEKLKQYAPGATVYLRIKVSDYGSKFPLSSKFGLDPIDAVKCALEAQKAGLNVKGITFHVGSQAENLQVWDAALAKCSKLIVDLEAVGIGIEFINIGGGFPANYEDLAPTIKDAAKVINKAVNDHVPKGVRIFAEPGRYVTANASVLVTSVIGFENRGGTDWLYLDMGVFQGLIEALEIGLKYPIFTEKSLKGEKKSYVLTGPSCDAFDTLGLDYVLPSDIKVGDRLYIGAAGAYSLVYGSNFNGFEVPAVYYVKGKRQ